MKWKLMVLFENPHLQCFKNQREGPFGRNERQWLRWRRKGRLRRRYKGVPNVTVKHGSNHQKSRASQIHRNVVVVVVYLPVSPTQHVTLVVSLSLSASCCSVAAVERRKNPNVNFWQYQWKVNQFLLLLVTYLTASAVQCARQQATRPTNQPTAYTRYISNPVSAIIIATSPHPLHLSLALPLPRIGCLL